MITICKGEHCPVRKQCARYTSVLETYKDDCKVILNCRNQRLFTKENPYTISQSTADGLAEAFKRLADAFNGFYEENHAQALKKAINTTMDNCVKQQGIVILDRYLTAAKKCVTSSWLTRWYWKRVADKRYKKVIDFDNFLTEYKKIKV
ncbi:MAG: hypothetical protein K6E94_00580 [Elusimicrobiaceae bacterium]|nr:hypothetical protein [Elusimicrobiaceae bacterium]